MKLTAVFLFIVAMHVSARSLSQVVTFSGKEVPLDKVFAAVEKQTGYVFFFDEGILKDSRPVSVTASDMPLEAFLSSIFKDQPLKYRLQNKTIVISRKAEPKLPVDSTIKVKGVVYNETGQPLSGATVTIKATGKGTITNAKGEFNLPSVQENAVLVVSFIGYTMHEVKVTEGGILQVNLSVAVNELDQAVVQAYGKTTQRISTGNIVKVTADEIGRQPVQNALAALEGKVTGLEVTLTSGYVTGPIKLELRGRSALSSSMTSDPLYIVDGVPLSYIGFTEGDGTYLYGSPGFIQNGMAGPAGGQSPLYNIRPGDIESIEVLKDADATAIYGSRGANGVILITTKSGKTGKASFDINVQEGITRVTRSYQMLNTPQYLEMRKEALRNDGLPIDPVNDYDINGTWDTTRYTDWQKKLIGKMGNSLSSSLSLTGGSAKTTFRLGAGFDRVTDITAVSGASQRISASANIQHRSADNRFGLSFSGNYSSSKSDNVYMPYINLAPDAPPIYDAAGKLNWAGWAGKDNNSSASSAFPFGVLLQPFISNSQFLNAGLSLGYDITSKIKASANVGYNIAQSTQNQYFPILSQDPNQNPTGTAAWGYNSNRNWIVEPQLTYTTFLSKGRLTVLAGSSLQQTVTEGVNITGSGYSTDDLLGTLSAASSLSSFQQDGQYKYAAVFGRITYDWEHKYIININGRRDGSSRFGSGKQFGNFGSIGAAWIFTEENWLKNRLKWLSFGKIRASYGTTGSDNIGDYKYLSQYTANNTLPYDNITPLRPAVIGNPDYRWQVNKKLELAFNGGLFRNRINFQVAYYRNLCGNQLIDYPLPLLTGFSSVAANSVAKIVNSGWEYSASFRIIDHKNFSWSASFNLSANKNKLLNYPNLALSPYAGTYVIGKPLNIRRLFHYTGVDPLTGYYALYDKNHDGQITYDPSGKTIDDTYPVDISPKYFGGFGSTMTFKGVQLDLYFAYKKQVGKNAFNSGNTPGRVNWNIPVELLDRWQKPGDNKPYALYSANSNLAAAYFYGLSDGSFTDASFLRLSNVSLSYTLPSSLLKGIKKLNIFINTNNLFVITNYKGIDPESQGYYSVPLTKTIIGGLSIQF